MKEEEKNIHMAFEILLNLYDNREQRQKLAQEGYLAKIFDMYSKKADKIIM